MKQFFIILAMLWSLGSIAQTVVTGKVTDVANGEPIPGANVKIAGKDLGTTTDFDGKFTLKVNENPPFTLEVSSIGYKVSTATVKTNKEEHNFTLSEEAQSLDEVVVSASRSPEKIKESPVTIERIDAKMIQNSANADFYEGLENLKGVDINTNSLTFKSINTRGFATFSNNRFLQLVDGMDNASPALNFVLGNLLGMNELDVNSVEILPGASSALYGANAFNGILFMTSKSPFEKQGISTYFKTGLTMQDVAGDNNFYDTGIRMAYKFSDKFAGKANFSFMKGTDWMAADYNMYEDDEIGKPNTIRPFSNDPDHDALNRYGDEVSTELDWTAYGNGKKTIARTGYNERDLTDYEARSVKADFALHFKPWANDKELIFNYKVGKGNTIYQGGNRYYLKDFILDQMKLEFKGKNFFIRGYRTTEDAGDSYDMRFAAINMQRIAKSDVSWFTDYTIAYNGFLHNPAFGGAFTGIAPAPFNHDAARTFADNNLLNNSNLNATQNYIIATYIGGGSWSRNDNARFLPGSVGFNNALNQVTNDPNLLTGAKFVDRTSMNHADANYNFKDVIDNWADLQLGGSYRLYSLKSKGTIFTDYDAPINYEEYGAYAQLAKKFADDRLKFTGSVRYDKAQNFDGAFSPRVALVYSAGEKKDHNFRASFQTGFRNPTTQDQYIGLDLGRAILVGSAPDNLDRYISKPIMLSNDGSNTDGESIVGATHISVSGRSAYDNAFTYSSVLNGAPVKSNVEYVKPEGVKAAELGYRGNIGKINVDFSGYYNMYEGFIATKTVIVPLYGQVGDNTLSLLALQNEDFKAFQVYTNSAADISSYGATFGLSTKINKFEVGANYTYAKFDFDQNTDPDYEAGFNTPEHKIKVSFGSEELFQNFGFGVNYRYQTEFLWQSNFADAMVPTRSVVDAQINYKVPSIKSEFKVGGSNIGGKNYIVAPGTGMIGSQYFVSWTINQ